jgi:hypothetical protein
MACPDVEPPCPEAAPPCPDPLVWALARLIIPPTKPAIKREDVAFFKVKSFMFTPSYQCSKIAVSRMVRET